MNWIALGFSLLAFQGLAQAQWADQDGFVDYGMTHQVIINGDEVPSAEAMIYYGTARIVSDMGDVLKNCSGTVIAPNVILTAAHCLMLRPQPANMKVRIAGKDHAVSSYVPHEGFVYTPPNEDHGAKTENDIALIFLRKNLPSRSVPALLPPQGWRIDVAVDGILAGYGLTSPAAKKSLGTLRWVEAVIEETGEHNLMVYGSRNFCQGDSGGPAYVKKDDRYAVIGVSSLANCKSRGVVVRVSDHVGWINAKISAQRSRRAI